MFVNKEVESAWCKGYRPSTSQNYDLRSTFSHQALRENEFSLGPLVFNNFNTFKDGECKPYLNSFDV